MRRNTFEGSAFQSSTATFLNATGIHGVPRSASVALLIGERVPGLIAHGDLSGPNEEVKTDGSCKREDGSDHEGRASTCDHPPRQPDGR